MNMKNSVEQVCAIVITLLFIIFSMFYFDYALAADDSGSFIPDNFVNTSSQFGSDPNSNPYKPKSLDDYHIDSTQQQEAPGVITKDSVLLNNSKSYESDNGAGAAKEKTATADECKSAASSAETACAYFSYGAPVQQLAQMVGGLTTSGSDPESVQKSCELASTISQIATGFNATWLAACLYYQNSCVKTCTSAKQTHETQICNSYSRYTMMAQSSAITSAGTWAKSATCAKALADQDPCTKDPTGYACACRKSGNSQSAECMCGPRLIPTGSTDCACIMKTGRMCDSSTPPPNPLETASGLQNTATFKKTEFPVDKFGKQTANFDDSLKVNGRDKLNASGGSGSGPSNGGSGGGGPSGGSGGGGAAGFKDPDQGLAAAKGSGSSFGVASGGYGGGFGGAGMGGKSADKGSGFGFNLKDFLPGGKKAQNRAPASISNPWQNKGLISSALGPTNWEKVHKRFDAIKLRFKP